MKASLIELQKTEGYLFQQLAKEEMLLFEAKVILNNELQQKVQLQQEAYGLIKLYGRHKLKSSLERAHQKLFSEPQHKKFKKKIYKIFNLNTL